MPDAPARPRQTTWSGWVILLGSLFVLASVFEVVAGINSLDTRRGAEEFLTTSPGDGLGLGVDEALEILRVTAMVAGACAVAATILGWQVLRRSRSARVALSVLALPLLISGTVTGGILSAAVAAAVVTLWLPPSSDWFAGREPRQPARRVAEPAGVGASSSPGHPPGHPPARTQAESRPAGAPAPTTVPARSGPDGPRPAALTVACVLTWVGSAAVVMFATLSLLVVWTSPDLVLEAVQQQDPSLTEARLAEQGLGVRTIQIATVVVVGLPVLWALAASVIAGFALLGRPWARTALLASAALAGLGSLVLSLFSTALVVPMVVCLVAAYLLLRPEVRAWR